MSDSRSGMGWEFDGMTPGDRYRLARLDRLEQAEVARVEAERQERIDERRELAQMKRDAWQRETGKPFPTEAQWLEAAWASDDARVAREHRRQLIDAGLLHLIDTPRMSAASPPPSSPPSPATAQRLGRITKALRQWASDDRTKAREAEQAKRYPQ